MMKTPKTSIPNLSGAADLPLTLANTHCIVNYFPSEKEVRGSDLTEGNNEPRFFTRSKRGLPAAWKVLVATFDEHTGMYFAVQVLHYCCINIHTYCAAD